MRDDLDDDGIDVLEVLGVLRSRWRGILGVPLVIGVLTLGVTFLITPTFTASTVIMPPAQQSSSALSALAGNLGALGGLAGAAGAIKNPADQYVAFLKSRNVLDRVIERFSLKGRYKKEVLQDTREVLSGRVRVTAGKKDSLIVVEVDDADPKVAADIANAFIDELRRVTSELAVSEASQRRLFFEGQLKTAREALSESEEALRASGISASALNTAPQAAVTAVAKLKATITSQEVRIASLQGFATEDNPDLRQARLELAALRAQLSQIEEGSPVKGEKASYTEKYRTFKYNETLFELMAKQYELARLDEAREGSVIQVLDVAIPPERKSQPKKAQITLAVSVAAGLATLLSVLLYELWWLRLSKTTANPAAAKTTPHS